MKAGSYDMGMIWADVLTGLDSPAVRDNPFKWRFVFFNTCVQYQQVLPTQCTNILSQTDKF